MSDDRSAPAPRRVDTPARDWWCLGAAYAFLLLWSFGRVPVPGVNEPHYLTKAKHFVDPQWCAGDLFLESSNPHWFFYATLGQLTRFMPLDQVAVAGRLMGLAVVAAGWQRLTKSVTGSAATGLGALPLFALLQSLGNWSGEWLVGGIEAKVFAYGCLFYGLGSWLDGAVQRGAIACGLAIAFHPLAGLWGVMAALGATAVTSLGSIRKEVVLRQRHSVGALIAAGALMGVLALPGIVPALAAVRAQSPEVARQADYLQVAGRLSHHLDPMAFPKESHRYFGMQIALWICLVGGAVGRVEERWWRWFVVWTLVIAAAGVVIGFGPRPIKAMPGWEWRTGLLKYYPFRLADLMVPIAISLSVSQVMGRRCWNREQQQGAATRAERAVSSSAVARGVVASLPVMLSMAAGVLAVIVPGPDRNPSGMSAERLSDWQEVLNWVRENSAADSLVFGLGERWAIRWYSQRPEYVNYKDCPQDPDSLMEWNRRLWEITQWNREGYVYGDGVFQPAELVQLRERTGIDYLICPRRIVVRAPAAYGNDQFAVYRLEDAASERADLPE